MCRPVGQTGRPPDYPHACYHTDSELWVGVTIGIVGHAASETRGCGEPVLRRSPDLQGLHGVYMGRGLSEGRLSQLCPAVHRRLRLAQSNTTAYSTLHMKCSTPLSLSIKQPSSSFPFTKAVWISEDRTSSTCPLLIDSPKVSHTTHRDRCRYSYYHLSFVHPL